MELEVSLDGYVSMVLYLTMDRNVVDDDMGVGWGVLFGFVLFLINDVDVKGTMSVNETSQFWYAWCGRVATVVVIALLFGIGASIERDVEKRITETPETSRSHCGEGER